MRDTGDAGGTAGGIRLDILMCCNCRVAHGRGEDERFQLPMAASGMLSARCRTGAWRGGKIAGC